MKESFPFIGSLVEVGEGHGGSRDPLESPLLNAPRPVVRPILWVDQHQDVLDEVVLILVEDVREVAALISAAVHGGFEVEPGVGEPVAAGVVPVPIIKE